MTDPALRHRSSEDDPPDDRACMTCGRLPHEPCNVGSLCPRTTRDDRPSIANLQRVAPALKEMRDTLARKEAEPLIHRAAPVLVEIAETGLAWAEAEDALATASHRGIAAMRATQAFDKHRAALAKVRR